MKAHIVHTEKPKEVTKEALDKVIEKAFEREKRDVVYCCPKCGRRGAIRLVEQGSGRLVSHLCIACGLVKPEVERMV